jgi:hypothetical protein
MRPGHGSERGSSYICVQRVKVLVLFSGMVLIKSHFLSIRIKLCINGACRVVDQLNSILSDSRLPRQN